MVKETTIQFTLDDISAIRIRCTNCPNEVVMRPGKDCIQMPNACGHCNSSWVQGNDKSDITRQLVYYLGHIQQEVTHPAVHLQLELRDN